MKAQKIVWYLLASLMLFAACEKDELPAADLVGEWQRIYTNLPDGNDTLYTPWFIEFAPDMTGVEELSGYWFTHFTYSLDLESVLLTFENGSQFRYTYERQGNYMMMYLKNDEYQYRLVTYER
jgi:hypothetical protein